MRQTVSAKLIHSAPETWKEKELGRQEKREGAARYGGTSRLLPWQPNLPARRTGLRRGLVEILQELRVSSDTNSFKRTRVRTNGGRHQALFLAGGTVQVDKVPLAQKGK